MLAGVPPPSFRAFRNALVPEWAMVPRFFDQFLAGHADAGVGDGQGLGLVVGGDVDFQRQRRLVDVLLVASMWRSFSIASEALEISSRRKISLSV